MSRLLRLFVALFLTLACLSTADVGGNDAAASSAGPTSARCARYASPQGSDEHGRGTLSRPFRSLTRLDRALGPGQAGCLETGVYGNLQAWHQLDTSGSAGAPVTIRPYPRAAVEIRGWVDIEGAWTTLEGVRIDGSNTLYGAHPSGVSCRDHVSQPLVLAGDHDVLQYDDYFQSRAALRGTGIGVGFWGDPVGDVIRHNRIHDVGGCDFYDHLIYLANGNAAQIYDNWMWNDPHGWGIKLDPSPTAARIWGNVIDRAGSGFNFGNSTGGRSTTDNEVFDNIVANSVGISNPDIHWVHPGVLVTSSGMLASSDGNEVFDNDSFHNRGGVSNVNPSVAPWQLRIHHNPSIAPLFVNSAAHDYTLRTSGQAALFRAGLR